MSDEMTRIVEMLVPTPEETEGGLAGWLARADVQGALEALRQESAT